MAPNATYLTIQLALVNHHSKVAWHEAQPHLLGRRRASPIHEQQGHCYARLACYLQLSRALPNRSGPHLYHV